MNRTGTLDWLTSKTVEKIMIAYRISQIDLVSAAASMRVNERQPALIVGKEGEGSRYFTPRRFNSARTAL